MKKWICKPCGWTTESETVPDVCPICGVDHTYFEEIKENNTYSDSSVSLEELNNLTWACEHGIGEAKEEEIKEQLNAFVNGECSEVGLYFAFARQAYREGYPEIGEVLKNIAIEEAEHAASFNELLGNVKSTKENLAMMVKGENGASKARLDLAILAKKLGNDAAHDAIHEAAKDEARHGKSLLGMLNRYFGK